MLEYRISDTVGSTTRQDSLFEGTLLLLDDYGTVLAANGEETLPRGADFFKTFDKKGAERAFFSRCGIHVGGDPVLLLLDKMPAVVFRALLHRAGVIPVFLPPASLRESFTHAAFFADSFERLHYSPAPLDEADFAAMNACYRPVFDAFYFDDPPAFRKEMRLTLLIERLALLARFAGIDFSYDLTGFAFASLDNVDEAWVCAAALAFFLWAGEVADAKRVDMVGEQMMTQGSVLSIGFESDAAGMPEALEEVFRAERERGRAVEIVHSGKTFLLTFPISYIEFSLEGGKQRPAAFDVTEFVNLPIPK